MECYAGLDFGTTFSSLSAVSGEKSFDYILDGTKYVRTILAITVDNLIYIGAAALNLDPSTSPHALYIDLKRWVGVTESTFTKMNEKIKPSYATSFNNDEFFVSGINRGYQKMMSIKSLIACFIEFMVKSFCVQHNLKILDMNVSVPADYRTKQRLFMKNILNNLSFPCRRIVNEPSAAAIYALSTGEDDSNILIYDFGGGTFDVSLVAKISKYAMVVDSVGDLFLGGRDIDNAISQFLKEKYPGIKAVSDPNFISLLKERTNDGQSRHLCVDDRGSPRILEFHQNDLNNLVLPYVRRSVELVDEIKSRYPFNMKLVLVGGSSLLKSVQNYVNDYARSVNIPTYIHPELRMAVSYGCAHLHHFENSGSLVYLDINSHPLMDICENADPDIILRSPMPIPMTITRKVTPQRYYNSSVDVYEGSHLFPLENDWIVSAPFKVADHVKLGESFDILYSYSSDGLLTCSIKNLSTGVVKTLNNTLSTTGTFQKIEGIFPQDLDLSAIGTLASILVFFNDLDYNLDNLKNSKNLIELSKNFSVGELLTRVAKYNKFLIDTTN